MSSYFNISF